MTVNKRIVVVMGLSILISGCLSANKEKNYNFIKGLNEYQKNDKVSALENYKKAYEIDKNNVVLLNEIAYLYVDLGNYNEAENYYKKALEIKPNDENYEPEQIALQYLNITFPSKSELFGKAGVQEMLMTKLDELAEYACE